MLPSAVHQLLPTPTASQFPSNKSLSPGATERPALSAINQLLPTPPRWQMPQADATRRTETSRTTIANYDPMGHLRARDRTLAERHRAPRTTAHRNQTPKAVNASAPGLSSG